jgi:SAM-dependent methyltransferase
LPVDSGAADLVVAAQAFHWFKREPFFAEVRRVLRPSGCLAAWCYGLASITPTLDALVYELYETRLGPSWEPERRLVEDGYASVTFPFAELAQPPFEMRLAWTFEHLMGYLGTWSALKRHIQSKGDNPLEDMCPRLEQAWGAAREREVVWPIHLRAFRVSKNADPG